MIGVKDNQYQKKVESKVARLEVVKGRGEAEEKRKEKAQSTSTAGVDVEGEGDDHLDPDFNENNRSKKPSTITLNVPRNILKQTVMTGARCGLGARSHTMNTAQFITSSNGSLEDFVLSKSSANRFRNAVAGDKAVQVKEAFQLKLEEIGRKFIVHFDGKLLEGITDSQRSVQERLAILLSSPDLPDPQLLGVPCLEGGTGEAILNGILETLKDWKVSAEHIVGMCFDTTATNTGTVSGACVNLELEMSKQLLYLACRHHIFELHIKHVSANFGRQSKGNEDALFRRFREGWNEVVGNGIDMGKLCKFDFSTVPKLVAEGGEKALIYSTKCLMDNTFPRGDYRELCQLAIIFLGGTVKNFTFKLPG